LPYPHGFEKNKKELCYYFIRSAFDKRIPNLPIMKTILIPLSVAVLTSFQSLAQDVRATILMDGSEKKNYINRTDRSVMTITGTGCDTFIAESSSLWLDRINDTEWYVFDDPKYEIALINFYCKQGENEIPLGTMRFEIRE